MPRPKPTSAADPSTEDRIKTAAISVFHKKGYAATRTRDIAEAAGINLALLNYYFRSKENLFNLIMLETLQRFLQSMKLVFHDPDTRFGQKLEIIADRYIDVMIAQPDLPLFIMSELRSHPGELLKQINAREILMKSAFFQQFKAAVESGKIPPQHFLQFLMNMMGLITFPFIAAPIFKSMGDLNHTAFESIMKERKKLIPKWLKAIIKVKPDDIHS